MPADADIDLDNPGNHDPALSRSHREGVRQSSQSPAERALAPEADAPLQSPNASADDGVYVGQSGGYKGGDAPAVSHGRARVDADNPRGEGTYGYPAGPEVGLPGGEHQPDDGDIAPPDLPPLP